MEAKDTVTPACRLCSSADNQAEISFKAGKQEGIKEGITLYAWWKDGVQYVGTCGRTLKEALADVNKEWGIK